MVLFRHGTTDSGDAYLVLGLGFPIPASNRTRSFMARPRLVLCISRSRTKEPVRFRPPRLQLSRCSCTRSSSPMRLLLGMTTRRTSGVLQISGRCSTMYSRDVAMFH